MVWKINDDHRYVERVIQAPNGQTGCAGGWTQTALVVGGCLHRPGFGRDSVFPACWSLLCVGLSFGAVPDAGYQALDRSRCVTGQVVGIICGFGPVTAGIQGSPSVSMTRASKKAKPCLAAVDR